MSENWKTYKLEDALEALIDYRGKTPKKTTEGVPLVTAKIVKQGRIQEPNEFIAKEDYKSWMSRGIPNVGDVVMTTEAPLGEVAQISDANIALAQRIVTLRGKVGVLDNGYLKYYLLSNKGQARLAARQSGTTVFGIKQSELRKVEIDCPTYAEQCSISNILSSIDDKIELNLQMNKTLEEMAMTLYKHWFVDDSKNIVESRPLVEILDFVVDNRGRTAPTASEGIPLIATNCVKNQRIYPTYEKVRYIDQETYKYWFRSHPVSGDILFVNKGAPGSVNLIPDPIDFCIAQDMIALRVNQKFVSNFYLFAYFRSPSVQKKILNMSVGTTIPHLKKTDLLKFHIPIPNSDYLKRYTNKVAPIYDQLNLNHIETQTLTTLRDTLLPKLISGEVRVKETEKSFS